MLLCYKVPELLEWRLFNFLLILVMKFPLADQQRVPIGEVGSVCSSPVGQDWSCSGMWKFSSLPIHGKQESSWGNDVGFLF